MYKKQKKMFKILVQILKYFRMNLTFIYLNKLSTLEIQNLFGGPQNHSGRLMRLAGRGLKTPGLGYQTNTKF
jgi:hypothetical protein